jgi:hypothetical protein
MMTEPNQSIYSVHLTARVVDRDNGKVLVPNALLCSLETPSLYYYQSDAGTLRRQILHLARVRYVYAVEAQLHADPQLAALLLKKDWMVEIEEAQCRITPDPTEDHRRRTLTYMLGGFYPTLQASAALRA